MIHMIRYITNGTNLTINHMYRDSVTVYLVISETIFCYHFSALYDKARGERGGASACRSKPHNSCDVPQYTITCTHNFELSWC